MADLSHYLAFHIFYVPLSTIPRPRQDCARLFDACYAAVTLPTGWSAGETERRIIVSHLSIYQIATETYQPMLKGLRHVLELGAEHARSAGLSEAEFIEARLAPDMLPLKAQVGIASDHVKGSLYRLANREVPSIADDMQSFPDLIARVDRTLELAGAIDPEELEGAGERIITLKMRDRNMTMPGSDYLLHFAIPNFYFHVTTTYALLRHKGVPLGKSDYFGRPRS